jgi:hypothetical protein
MRIIRLPASIAVNRMLVALNESMKGSYNFFKSSNLKYCVLSQATGPWPDVLSLFIIQFGGFTPGMQALSFGCKFWVSIRFQEATHRTPEGTYRNAFFLWYSRNSPKILFRCSLNPVDDTMEATVLAVQDEPLHHLAVALGALNGFRTHARISGK